MENKLIDTVPQKAPAAIVSDASAARQRLVSLDAFRGLTIALMIVVNDPGSFDAAYAQLRHARWNGLTVTDLVFPFFLFIVGASLVFSLARRRGQQAKGTQAQLSWHIARRASILFVIGLFLNGFPFWIDPNFSLGTWRIPGVLQRIAVCYLCVSVLVLKTSPRAQLYWAAALLAFYLLALKVIPVPGFGSGVLDPVGNLAWFIDSSLLKGHTWVYAPAEGFDPEGILSTLPAIATTILGAAAGHLLRSAEKPPMKKVRQLLFSGVLCLLLGWSASVLLPLNKNLWTSSYALVTAGLAFAFLAILYWMIDIRKNAGAFTPFTIFGLNAITVYAASELLATTLWLVMWPGTTLTLHDVIYEQGFASWASPENASLAFALAFTFVVYALAWALWKKKWFLKI